MSKKGLTLTVIFQAQSLNYGEGIANIAELKKLTRMDGNMYTFASRQAVRYDIVRLGHDFFNWNLQVVDKGKGTVQFKDECTIKDSQEMDLFGYMKTSKKGEGSKGGSSVRPAVARLSNAISLEPYRSDMDFLNNKGLADRIGEHPNLANSEQHLSFYTYTITIDLENVGIDLDVKLDNKERSERVNQLLDILKVLNRNIRGRQENLSPLFVIGGVYDVSNPFFLGRIKLQSKNGAYYINKNMIEETLEMKLFDKCIKEDTLIGVVDGIFANKDELANIVGSNMKSVEQFFQGIKLKVNEYYGV
ncbi:type I-B CRISPR-associated protein Cas7/Cst2/DevR [Clostridium aciditolerans]|uniref:Type I-B CRISPR-associated protein Cas7/Cst2/DevR n=1 Tax=Clostridium aciditolerans TaxID=339861 RepID=A0A934I3N0_9CLOT|nr:type I-B CRISPR-associated protein Cas7/Cst2/DevR [Clostridium aciditolerans]MBI6875678.1 type I-B CRISPR-associated protein Cas7/Cst2/DevR [Clostridium aciditolerans]